MHNCANFRRLDEFWERTVASSRNFYTRRMSHKATCWRVEHIPGQAVSEYPKRSKREASDVKTDSTPFGPCRGAMAYAHKLTFNKGFASFSRTINQPYWSHSIYKLLPKVPKAT